MTWLGIDVGTGSTKVGLVDEAGHVTRLATRNYEVKAEQPSWAESDPDDWIRAIDDAATELLSGNGSIEGVGFSGQMHGVVLADERLDPVRPAIIWADARSASQAASMANALSPKACGRLGSQPVPGFAATTLAWLIEHEPESMDRAVFALQAKDWVRAKLGGEVLTEPSDASGTLLYDLGTRQWSADAIAWAGINPALLPKIVESSHTAGTIALASREVPACVGGADTACAIAGMALRTGSGFISVGTGAQVVSLFAGESLEPDLTTHTFARVGDGGDLYRIGAVQNAGLALERVLIMLSASIEEANTALQAGVQPSDPLFVPYLAGERTPFMDPHLRGAFIGLDLATTRDALLRSTLEGIGQAVALALQALVDAGADMPEVIPLIGGGSHAPAFREFLSNATGRSIGVVEAPNASVVGAALLGSDVEIAPVAPAAVVDPDPNAQALLAERRVKLVDYCRAGQ